VLAGHAHHAGGGLDRQVEAALGAARAVLPESRDRAVDERGLAGAEPVPAEAEPLHRAGPAILDEHVGLEHQRAGEVARGRVLEVEHDRALAAVDRCEVLAEAFGDRRPLPHRVAVGRLDLRHVGAEVGEQHAAKGARRHVAELDDAHAREGAEGFLAHASVPAPAAPRTSRRRPPRCVTAVAGS
jgi:hypothetical protein